MNDFFVFAENSWKTEVNCLNLHLYRPHAWEIQLRPI